MWPVQNLAIRDPSRYISFILSSYRYMFYYRCSFNAGKTDQWNCDLESHNFDPYPFRWYIYWYPCSYWRIFIWYTNLVTSSPRNVAKCNVELIWTCVQVNVLSVWPQVFTLYASKNGKPNFCSRIGAVSMLHYQNESRRDWLWKPR